VVFRFGIVDNEVDENSLQLVRVFYFDGPSVPHQEKAMIETPGLAVNSGDDPEGVELFPGIRLAVDRGRVLMLDPVDHRTR
jgi:hypothetical protein